MSQLQLRPSGQIFNASTLPSDPSWWQSCVIYQIYPRSYQDTNSDGVGDLRGIQQRLPYLRDLGIDAIWISPFFKSPMADFGYDVSDYCEIDPLFGTMNDFDALLSAAHAHDIRLIIDFVPNHTSNQHPWFLESRSSWDNPKRDWYIWRNPKPDGSPPTNLVSFFQGSAWTYDEVAQQYYLHMFLPEQPDLNWRNPEVVEAMHNVMRFWLEKGVDGFRLDAITVLIKHEEISNLPEHAVSLTGLDLLLHLVEIHNQPDLHTILKGFRNVLTSYHGDPVLVGETNATDFDELVEFYGTNLDEIHLPTNLRTLNLAWDAALIRQSLTEYYDALYPGATPNFALGNHDQSRLATRFGPENHRSAHCLLLTAWGVPIIYYGDELGMVDGYILPEQRQDPFIGENNNVGAGRDPERTPMQWDDSRNAGFTDENVQPWLPVNTTFRSNVLAQASDPASSLNFCKRLLKLRAQSPALQFGSFQFMDVDDQNLLIYERRAEKDRFLIVINFGGGSYTLDAMSLAEDVQILLSSETLEPTTASIENITVHAHESLILKLS